MWLADTRTLVPAGTSSTRVRQDKLFRVEPVHVLTVLPAALNEDGTYRESVFYNTIGEAFIPIAFQIAAEVTPNSKLYCKCRTGSLLCF